MGCNLIRSSCLLCADETPRSELTAIFRILARHRLDISVANKLICSNVVLFDPSTNKRRAHCRHHSGRPGNVVDGSLQDGQMPAQHLLVYQSRLALPFLLGFRHFCHGADQAEIGICRLQSPQCVQESSVFGPPIGIEQVKLLRQPVPVGLLHHAKKWCDSDSACKEYGWLCQVLMQGEGACGWTYLHFCG